jgi:hypothetical protein
MQTSQDRPDLEGAMKNYFNGPVTKVCSEGNGIWAYYWQGENYTSPISTDSNQILFQDCLNYKSNTSTWIGSVRLIGEEGRDRLNIFHDPYFQSNMTSYTHMETSFSASFQSAILIGGSVQLWEKENRQGYSYCILLDPTLSPYVLIPNISAIGIQPENIKSIWFYDDCNYCNVNCTVINVQRTLVEAPSKNSRQKSEIKDLSVRSSIVIREVNWRLPLVTFEIWEDHPELAQTWQYYPATYLFEACATGNGIWVYYYNGENYTGLYPPRILPRPQPYPCQSYTGPSKIGSARFAGERGISRLNLYQNVAYEANATYILVDQPSISVNFSSLILIGENDTQLFQQENYLGLSICVKVNTTEVPYTSVGNVSTIGIVPGDIHSIRFGCKF